MLNINLLVLPLHWKFTSTPAQLGRGNARSLETAGEYGLLIALLHRSRFWQVSSANTRPKGSCFVGPALSPLVLHCFKILQRTLFPLPLLRSAGSRVREVCLPAALPPSWQGEHTCNSLTGWQRLTYGAGASTECVHGILIKPGRKEDWRRYWCPIAPHSSAPQHLSLQPELH